MIESILLNYGWTPDDAAQGASELEGLTDRLAELFKVERGRIDVAFQSALMGEYGLLRPFAIALDTKSVKAKMAQLGLRDTQVSKVWVRYTLIVEQSLAIAG